MPMCRHAPAKRVGWPAATLSRGQGTAARLKHSACPSRERSAFTQLASRNSAKDWMGGGAVAMSIGGPAINGAEKFRHGIDGRDGREDVDMRGLNQSGRAGVDHR